MRRYEHEYAYEHSGLDNPEYISLATPTWPLLSARVPPHRALSRFLLSLSKSWGHLCSSRLRKRWHAALRQYKVATINMDPGRHDHPLARFFTS